MSDADPIAVIEYESLVFGRHLPDFAGPRRRGGVLDQSAYTLLSILDAAGAQSIGDLSATTGLDASTLHRQTAALVRHGYAERIADRDGGIARRFQMTALGSQMLSEERRLTREALGRLLADWDEADRVAFGTLLGRMNRAVESRFGRHWPRPEHSSGPTDQPTMKRPHPSLGQKADPRPSSI
ncbi:MAG: MarR family winged helix-turn-helix transcriptional regulator [Acidipropionibacterium sp.]|jgi:DNA-binding MarR family transcriptional regulator|nr:MarR family winged helix-turn-helix transcriptional regulator [Acidipropionibacterium sp.]